MKKKYVYFLYFFPVAYLLLGFYFRQVFGDLSLRSTDPDYIHFISGLCVSTGKFSQANIDHPGSFLHLLLAIVFRIVYFFRQHNLSYFEDAILHSDLYLAVGNLVITTILAGAIFWAGKAVYKTTKNFAYALSVQSAPFLMNIWYEMTGRIYDELLLLIPVYIITVLLLRELYDENLTDKKRSLLYALAIAIGLSLKMTFLPFAFLPLFFIKPVRDKLKYLFYTVLFFVLFSLPVVFQFQKFKDWMIGIFMHSGAYESGSKGIINSGLFIKNVGNLFHTKTGFFEAFFLLLLLLVVLIITKKAKKIFIRLGSGITLVVLLLVFIMGKHYQMRYFVPALLFYPLFLVLIVEFSEALFPRKTFRFVLGLLLVLFIGYKTAHEIPYIRLVSRSVGNQMAARIKTRDVVNALPEKSYKIIVSQDYGCPLQAYAIMYSFAVGGKRWPHYREKLNRLYPDVYQYFTWDNSLRYWGKPFIPDTVVSSGKPVYVYLQNNSTSLYRRTVFKLIPDSARYNIHNRLIFKNPRNGEVVRQLFLSKK